MRTTSRSGSSARILSPIIHDKNVFQLIFTLDNVKFGFTTLAHPAASSRNCDTQDKTDGSSDVLPRKSGKGNFARGEETVWSFFLPFHLSLVFVGWKRTGEEEAPADASSLPSEAVEGRGSKEEEGLEL